MRFRRNLERAPFIFSACWSVAAGLYLLLKPVTILEEIAQAASSGAQSFEQVERQVSWYQVQGAWGVFILLVFALLFSGIGYLAIKTRYGMLAGLSVIAVALTFLAGFSIGPLYLPAVAGVMLGWVLLAAGRLLGQVGEGSR